MLSLLGLILPGLFQTINSITNAIANEKIALLKAQTEEDKVASQERINTLEAKRAALLADSQHSSLDMWIRAGLSIGPATYITKIFLWDKVLKMGVTDPVTSDQWQVLMAVVGFYFVYSGAVSVARIFKS
jgi:hypothetical protein